MRALSFCVLVGLLFSWNSGAAPSRPNIVVILCDDLGYGDLACYGHPHIRTPNLDRMAAEGIRYTACYSAAPVCSPSRVGLLTGRSPNRAGVYDWIPAAGKDSQPDARDQVHLRESEVTIANLLKKAGYATCLSGKWHCNARFNSEAQPQPDAAGFEHWFATQNNAGPSHRNPRNYVRNGKAVGALEGFSCQLATDEVLGWIEDKGAPDTDQPPFFAFLAFHEPHEPVASPQSLVDGYREVAENENQAQYFANVENVDRAVGRLLEALKQSGKDENTLVVFSSDNGPETLDRYPNAVRCYGSPGPLRGMKLWTTDGGVRVAGIARWPGVIKAGQVIDAPVSSLDLLPTFCALAGAEVPAGLALDGINLAPHFGAQEFERPKPLIWCYYNALNEQRVAMRRGDWKVLATLNKGKLPTFSNVHAGNAGRVRNAKLGDVAIYRVTDDIGESADLAEKEPERFEELTRLLLSAWEELVRGSHVWGGE